MAELPKSRFEIHIEGSWDLGIEIGKTYVSRVTNFHSLSDFLSEICSDMESMLNHHVSPANFESKNIKYAITWHNEKLTQSDLDIASDSDANASSSTGNDDPESKNAQDQTTCRNENLTQSDSETDTNTDTPSNSDDSNDSIVNEASKLYLGAKMSYEKMVQGLFENQDRALKSMMVEYAKEKNGMDVELLAGIESGGCEGNDVPCFFGWVFRNRSRD